MAKRLGLNRGGGKRPRVKKFRDKSKKSGKKQTDKRPAKTANSSAQTKKPFSTPSSAKSAQSDGGDSSKKRVSFATKLVHSLQIDELPSESPSATPNGNETPVTNGGLLKPILKKRKLGGTSDNKKPKLLKLNTGEAKVINFENEEEPEPQEQTEPSVEENVFTGRKKPFRLKLKVTRQLKQKLKEMPKDERRLFIQKMREERKPLFELSVKAKRLWEKIRRKKDNRAAEKEKLINELYGLVEGKVKQLIYAHDTVRVIQCLMALKKHLDIRNKLFDETKDEILLMSKSKYARFFVVKMLKYGTSAQRECVMEALYGKIPVLVKHTFASDVVEYAYNEYANALQRSRIISEFYSAEYALWKSDEPVALAKIFETEPGRKDAILKSMKHHIMALSSKPSFRHSIVHRLISEFFQFCTDADRKDVIDAIIDRVVEIVHTRDGTLVAMQCIWHGSAKERKHIIRSMKTLVPKICMEEYGYLLLLTIFDCTDDTVTVDKVILKEICGSLRDIIKSNHGVKVLHYLMKPRCPRHFLKQTVELLARGDNNAFSKKDRNVKLDELRKSMSPILLNYCAENTRELLMDAHTSLLVQSILYYADGDKTPVYEAIANVLDEEFIPCNMESLHPVEFSPSHFVLIHLVKLDKELFPKNEKTLSEVLAAKILPTQLLAWMSCNKGAFLLLRMYETEIPHVQKAVKDVVCSPAGRKKLKQYSFSSAILLSKKLLC